MNTYLFQGVVLPERAQLSLSFSLDFQHLVSGFRGSVRVNILLNQVAVWVDSEEEWDVFDLRNVVKNIVQNNLAVLGYLRGFAYDLEITRVLNPAREIDYVFGIDIPCIAERNATIDVQAELERLRHKAAGPSGIFVQRCFTDLISAMKHADDTGFYCYRAIESLRHHCASIYGLSGADKARQWEKLREMAGCTEQELRVLKGAADPLRHGEAVSVGGDGRARLFVTTWNIVDGYLKNV